MAPVKKITKKFTLHVVAGKAQPAPPVGPILWQNGVNIGAFIKEFNEKTGDIMKKFAPADVKVPAIITVYADRTYDLEIGIPLTSHLLLWKLGQKMWSGEPNKKKIGTLTPADIAEIAEIKRPGMNTNNMDSIMTSIIGTAKSLGIEVK